MQINTEIPIIFLLGYRLRLTTGDLTCQETQCHVNAIGVLFSCCICPGLCAEHSCGEEYVHASIVKIRNKQNSLSGMKFGAVGNDEQLIFLLGLMLHMYYSLPKVLLLDLP